MLEIDTDLVANFDKKDFKVEYQSSVFLYHVKTANIGGTNSTVFGLQTKNNMEHLGLLRLARSKQFCHRVTFYSYAQFQ